MPALRPVLCRGNRRQKRTILQTVHLYFFKSGRKVHGKIRLSLAYLVANPRMFMDISRVGMELRGIQGQKEISEEPK